MAPWLVPFSASVPVICNWLVVISPQLHVGRVLPITTGFLQVYTPVYSCSNTGSVIRDDPYWTSDENNLELIEQFHYRIV